MKASLTVFFEDPFWVGVFERIENGKLSVCKVTFGAEPKDYDVLDFVLYHYYELAFSPAIETETRQAADNPQRRLRNARKHLENTGMTYSLRRISDMNEYIAYCGLDCETCEARLATVNNDDTLRQRVAREWSELNGVRITAEMINCSGCRIPGVKTPYCDSLCPIRQCARLKQMETCGSCPEMNFCEKLSMITVNNADALRRLKEQSGECDDIIHIGYCLGKAWWHQGIMSETLKAVIDYFFDKVGANRIECRHDPRNPYSGMVMKKCGMKYEGTMRESDRNNQGVCDASWYALLRSER